MARIYLQHELRELSGDLRNSSVAIVMITELLQNDSILTNEQRNYINQQYLTDLSSTGRRLEALASQIEAKRKIIV